MFKVRKQTSRITATSRIRDKQAAVNQETPRDADELLTPNKLSQCKIKLQT